MLFYGGLLHRGSTVDKACFVKGNKHVKEKAASDTSIKRRSLANLELILEQDSGVNSEVTYSFCFLIIRWQLLNQQMKLKLLQQ